MTIILRLFAWGLAAAIAFATLGPPEQRPHSNLGQNGEHAFAFVLLGLEHSVANMFLFPQAWAAGADIGWQAAAQNLALSTLGNIIGGAGGVIGTERALTVRRIAADESFTAECRSKFAVAVASNARMTVTLISRFSPPFKLPITHSSSVSPAGCFGGGSALSSFAPPSGWKTCTSSAGVSLPSRPRRPPPAPR